MSRFSYGPRHVSGWRTALSVVVVGLAALVTLSRLLAGMVWQADILELFRPYLALLVTLAAIAAFFLGSRLAFAGALALAIANVAMLAFAGFGATQSGPGGSALPLKVATFNCLGSNPNRELFESWVRRTRPDIIALEEMPRDWSPTLESLQDIYPYRASKLGAAIGETDLLSRYPITEAVSYAPTDPAHRAVKTVIEVGKQKLDVFAMHPDTLTTEQDWKDRNVFLALAGQWVSTTATNRARIVLGDWNVAQWSPYFGDFTKAAGVKAADAGLLPAVTRVLFSLGGINFGSPIDHVAVNGAFSSKGCEVGPDLRSDHLPLVCRLVLH